MKSPARVLVHRLFATHLRIAPASITDAKTFVELSVDALDLLFLVIRLENLDPGDRDFPVDSLLRARTVGDFVSLVDTWLQDNAAQRVLRPASPCAAHI